MRIIDVEQGSDAWLSLRKEKITSTDMGAVLNLNPYKTALQLWDEKISTKDRVLDNEAIRRGRDSEDDARVKMQGVLDMEFTPRVIVSDEYPWLMASLDGLSEGLAIGLEIKTPMPKNYRTQADNEILKHYEVQMQTAIAASDGVIDHFWFCVYSPELDEVSYRLVYPDPEMMARIIKESKEFWRRLREFDPPSPIHRVVETDAMRRAVDEYLLACEMEKRAKTAKDGARENLIELSDGESIEGCGAKVTHYRVKGAVDYKAIPELDGVDLEKYRKEPGVGVRISFS